MYKKYPHKVGDVKQTIHELILYEDDMDGGGYSLKEKEYIAKLNLKFQVLNYLNWLVKSIKSPFKINIYKREKNWC